jgi:cyclopropane fatty-acyl-phospholipid synthase-like methyltransferase
MRRIDRRLVQEFLHPQDGDRILDIGCGPARILRELPTSVEYYGFDIDARYVASAERKYGSRGRFWVGQVGLVALAGLPKFDAVLAVGVLHHLDDRQASDLFRLANEALRPGGRVVTFDPCRTDDDSRLVRFVLNHDRGRGVRRPQEYARLAATAFERVESSVFPAEVRIPYTANVLVCEKT